MSITITGISGYTFSLDSLVGLFEMFKREKLSLDYQIISSKQWECEDDKTVVSK